jgi:MoaA/NifB/PqqE/SkfB family radical SAM enzyme
MNTYLNNPSKLQFELSSMCNALCLGCVRTNTNSFNEKKYVIPEKEYISFDVFKKIILSPSFASVGELEFCGTIDDPLMHPEFLEFLDFAAETQGKKYTVYIHTNASLRNKEYWIKLAQVLKKHKRHMVKFSIDGLEDTNHVYRQNTTWSKIMENAQAFIDAGGTAGWQYLIFPWNEHQVMDAKKLSVEMGFTEFMSRHDRSLATKLGLKVIQKRKEINASPDTWSSSLYDINSSLENEVQNDISCNNQNKLMYFIGHDSKIWPCCFLHNGFMNLDRGKANVLHKRLFDAYGSDDWNDLSKHSVEEVLAHDFYKNDLVASWGTKTHGLGKTDRIHRCTEVCNVKKLEVLPIGNYKIL